MLSASRVTPIYAIKPTPEQALGTNRTEPPARLIAALGFTGELMAITDAQSLLLKRIIELTREDDKDRHARWAGAAPDAKKYAEDGYLLLGRGWVFDFVLSQEGVVFVAPTEKKGPLRRASPLEVLCGLYPAIQVYPELLSFLPSRGKDSIECPSCKGTGFIGELRKSGAQTAQPNCICGGAGWLPSDYQTQLPIGESW